MTFSIGDTLVGGSAPTFIVAEMSANHAGSLDKALRLVEAAAQAGANAIKLQTYTPDTITINSEGEDFRLNSGPWAGFRSMWDLYQAAQTPWEWHEIIYRKAKLHGLEVFSSPFDETAVDFLEEIRTPAYKVASPEINHIPLLRAVAKTGKPVILSTGLARKCDIELAIETLRSNGCQDVALLKCTSAYPTPASECNLLTIPDMGPRFDVTPGISDHSLGSVVAVAAVSLGAKIVEKHFRLDDDEPTVDAFFSNTPEEFRRLVTDIRTIEEALGSVDYEIAPSAKASLRGMRSIYVCDEIRKGEFINKTNIRCVRPALGLHPKHYDEVIGRKARRNMRKGERLRLEDVE